MKNLKNSALIIVVIALVGFLGYRYTQKEETSTDDTLSQSKEVKATARYIVPDGEDNVRFILALDKDGSITDVRTEDATTNEADVHMVEFSNKLSLVIKGKKLSELTEVDKVGTSSLTTDAFNGVIDVLKAQQ